MRVAPPPPRRRSPDHLAGHPPLGYVSESASGQVQALEEQLSWDHFDAEVTDRDLPIVVHCRGGLDFVYADRLRDVFAGITEREVVVDLRRLTFIDSTGLSVLLSARRTLQDVGGMLWIRGASGMVRRVFEVVELADVLDD